MKISFQSILIIILALSFGLISQNIFAESAEENVNTVDLVNDNRTTLELVPGVKYDIVNNSLWYEYVDLNWPGNGMDLVIQRSLFHPDNFKNRIWKVVGSIKSEWVIHVPVISLGAILNVERGELPSTCMEPGIGSARPSANTAGGGPTISYGGKISGGYWVVREPTSLPNGTRYANNNNNIISCKDTHGYVVRDDDGKKYYFEDYSFEDLAHKEDDGRPIPHNSYYIHEFVDVFLTKVEDLHGNWIKYDYDTLDTSRKRIRRIYTSDGREVLISYVQNNNDDVIQKISTNDGRIWSYTHSPEFSVTYPTGLTESYSSAIINNEKIVNITSRLGASYKITESTSLNNTTPRFLRTLLKKIDVSGPEMEPYQINVSIPQCTIFDKQTDNNLGDCDAGFFRDHWDDQPLAGVYTRTLWVQYPDQTHAFKIARENKPNRGGGAWSGPPLVTEKCHYKKFSEIAILCSKFTYLESAFNTLMRDIGARASENKTVLTSVTQIDNLGNNTAIVYSDFNATLKPQKITKTGNYLQVTKNVYEADLNSWIVNQLKQVRVGTENGATFNQLSKTDYTYINGKLATINTDGITTKYTYDINGNLESETLPSGQVNEYRNYYRGVPQTLIYALGSPEQYSITQTVNSSGKLLSETNVKGYTIWHTYDIAHRHIGTEKPGYNGSLINWSFESDQYSSSPRLRKETTTGNLKSTSFYNGRGQVVREINEDISTISPFKQITSVTFDIHGRTIFQSLPYSNNVGFGKATEYDILNRIVKEIDTSDNSTHIFEHLTNNRVRVTDPDGYRSIYTYESTGTLSNSRLASTKIYRSQPANENDAYLVNVIHDEIGKVLRIQQIGQVGNQTITYTERRLYDARNRLCKTIRPEFGLTAMHYRDDGQLSWQAMGVAGSNINCDHGSVLESQKTRYDYTGLGILLSVSYPDGMADKTYVYQAGGILERLISHESEWFYTTNDLLLLESETLKIDGMEFPISYTFDSNFYIDSITYPDGEQISYNLNAFGWPLDIEGFASNANYHPSGVLTSFTYGNGVTYSKTLNSKNLPAFLTYTNPSAIDIFNNSYVYDGRANTIQINDLVNSTNHKTLTYDGASQLKTATGPWGSSAYEYDLFGNIIRKNIGNETITYNYDYSKNLLTNATSTAGWTKTFSYDKQGNVFSNGVNHFIFNDANSMVGVLNLGNSYVYDGYGRRVKQTKADGSTYSIYDKNGILRFRKKPNGETTSSVYLGRQLIAEIKNNYVSRPSSQPTVGGAQYLPYGKRMGEEKEGIGFTGHIHDNDLNLTYMQQRYYDPLIGRFYSNDPLDFLGHVQYGNPTLGFNRYAYANNNPYKFVDPDGRNPCILGPIAIGICAIGAAILVYTGVEVKDKYEELGEASMEAALKREQALDAMAKAMKHQGSLKDAVDASAKSSEAYQDLIKQTGITGKALSQIPGTSMSGTPLTSQIDLVISGTVEVLKATSTILEVNKEDEER